MLNKIICWINFVYQMLKNHNFMLETTASIYWWKRWALPKTLLYFYHFKQVNLIKLIVVTKQIVATKQKIVTY